MVPCESHAQSKLWRRDPRRLKGSRLVNCHWRSTVSKGLTYHAPSTRGHNRALPTRGNGPTGSSPDTWFSAAPRACRCPLHRIPIYDTSPRLAAAFANLIGKAPIPKVLTRIL